MPFQKLGLISPLARAVAEEGYETPTPIQTRSLPLILRGKDLLGVAQTGTGKTAAFALPILQLLSHRPARNRNPRALILSPTRELAIQIGRSFSVYGQKLRVKHTVIVGGVQQQRQVQSLQQGVDIVIATPGRLGDLIQQKRLFLDAIEIFVLDEADRMLDMGFIPDIRRISALLPKNRQTLLFSATMPREVRALAESLLSQPERVDVAPTHTDKGKIQQSLYEVKQTHKRDFLLRLLQTDPTMARVLVFTRTKHGANRLTRDLAFKGLEVEAIHGNKTQNARVRALKNFSAGRTRVLVATDVAARGIDVDAISHVVNYDLPNIPETYVHRIGRTARAGASGVAISFYDRSNADQCEWLKDIEKWLGTKIPRATEESRPSLPGKAVVPPTLPRQDINLVGDLLPKPVGHRRDDLVPNGGNHPRPRLAHGAGPPTARKSFRRAKLAEDFRHPGRRTRRRKRRQ
jgi:ATP-dependent RNA helicase RhlE